MGQGAIAMSKIRGDILIKKLRQEHGLTQVQLCEGICDQNTLSRIERGERVPSRWVFEQLMERLGENPDKYPYSSVVTTDDKRVADLKDKLKILSQEKSTNEAAEMINKLENDTAFDTKENQQFLLRQKATVSIQRKNYEDALNYALKSLRITRPNFDIDRADIYIFNGRNLVCFANCHCSFNDRAYGKGD
jgi:transcriptional regulator with XRE-family HTH domain